MFYKKNGERQHSTALTGLLTLGFAIGFLVFTGIRFKSVLKRDNYNVDTTVLPVLSLANPNCDDGPRCMSLRNRDLGGLLNKLEFNVLPIDPESPPLNCSDL